MNKKSSSKKINLLTVVVMIFSVSCSMQESKATPSPFPSSTIAPFPTRTSTSTLKPTLTRTITATQDPYYIYTAVAQTVDSMYGTRPPTATLAPTITPEANQKSYSLAEICRSNVDAMRGIKKDLRFSEHFQTDTVPQPGDFNVNSYLRSFTHLSLETGYRFDYAYFLDELGGKPFLYSVPKNIAPFKTYDEYMTYLEDADSYNRSYMTLGHAYDYSDHIFTDDTRTGYFQLLMLLLQGDQFYLYWHGLYNDTIILCDTSDLQAVNDELNFFEPDIKLDFSDEVKDQIPNLDLEPRIDVGQTTITIRVVLFSKWVGFWESFATFKRTPRHEFLNGSQNLLIPYDCGVSF